MKRDLSHLKSCQRDEDYDNHALGRFRLLTPSNRLMTIVASDGLGWEHVSVSLRDRCPTWEEMCWVKDLFWDEEEVVIQYHPTKSQQVNFHPYCLHLWKPTSQRLPMPDPELVGPLTGKAVGL